MQHYTQLLERQKVLSSLSQEEFEVIRDYFAEYTSLRGTTPHWIETRVSLLCQATRAIHSEAGATLDVAGTSDYLVAVSWIRDRGGYKPNYSRQIILALKVFAQWYVDLNPRINLSKINAIKIPSAPKKTKTPEDMLSRPEVLTLIKSCHNSRDRALIATLYDGSNRPIEVLDLTWKDLHFDNFGAWFETNRKTGKHRRIRLTIAVPYLAQWKTDYPEEVEGDAPVFCTLFRAHRRRMTKYALDEVIHYLKRETGIKVCPYSFRPSRITHDVEDGFDLQYIMMKNWGSLDTKMINVYTNLKDDYIDSYALEKAGIVNPAAKADESKRLLPVECPHCYTLNPPGSEFCSKCGQGLTVKAAEEANKLDGVSARRAKDMIDYLQKLIDSGDLPQSE